MPEINYPTWKLQGHPTPNEMLVVCDNCGYAVWVTSNPFQSHCGRCRGKKGGQVRMREATAAETEEGKKHLKEIIGG